jgi:hypothetical protein
MKKLFILSVITAFLISYSDSFSQWTYTNGPYGGSIQAYAVSGNNIFAGTAGAGVFISTDNGANWIPSNAGLGINNIYAFVINGSNIF